MHQTSNGAGEDVQFKIGKRSKQIYAIQIDSPSIPLHFSFSSKSGSVGMRAIFQCCLSDSKTLSINNLTALSSVSFECVLVENDREQEGQGREGENVERGLGEVADVKSGIELECNYFASKTKYFTFHVLDRYAAVRELADSVEFVMQHGNSKSKSNDLPGADHADPNDNRKMTGDLICANGNSFFCNDINPDITKNKLPLTQLEPQPLMQPQTNLESRFIEIMPLVRYPSNKMTIRGKLKLPSTGTLFFIFNNSFSIQKAKLISLSLSQHNHSYAGWIYKKYSRLFKKRWLVFCKSQCILYIYKTNSFSAASPSSSYSTSTSQFSTINMYQVKRVSLHLHKLELVLVQSDGKTVHFRTKRLSELKFWFDLFNECISLHRLDAAFDCITVESASSSIGSKDALDDLLLCKECTENSGSDSSDSEIFYDAVGAACTAVSKRLHLPAKTVPFDFKIMDLLRKPRAPLPITLSEPISLLQKLCEDLEYADTLLSKEALQLNEFNSVCAFALSPYASGRYRDRKPFNPVLGETYEFESGRLRFFSEKISHEPLVVACHTVADEFEYWNSLKIQTQLKGLSLEVQLQGKNFLRVKSTGNIYEWNRANTSIKGFSQDKTIETVGDVLISKIINNSAGSVLGNGEGIGKEKKAEIKFKSSSLFSKSANCKVEGAIYGTDSLGQEYKYGTVSGCWDTEIFLTSATAAANGKTSTLFKSHAHPPFYKDNYGFTYFAINLNHESTIAQPHASLPLSDSRRRPDMRYFELGNVDEARQEKERIEVRQRERRAQLSLTGYEPKWFVKNDRDQYMAKRDSSTEELMYWKDRKRNREEECEDKEKFSFY